MMAIITGMLSIRSVGFLSPLTAADLHDTKHDWHSNSVCGTGRPFTSSGLVVRSTRRGGALCCTGLWHSLDDIGYMKDSSVEELA